MIKLDIVAPLLIIFIGEDKRYYLKSVINYLPRCSYHLLYFYQASQKLRAKNLSILRCVELPKWRPK